MIFTESIYFLILFTLPAALHIIYHVYIRQVPRINKDKSVELAECVLFCLCVFFVNLVIMNKDIFRFAEYILTDDKAAYCKSTKFDYLEFIIKYFIINMMVSIGSIIIWYLVFVNVYKWIVNKVNKITGKPQEYPFSDVWRNIFETTSILDVEKCVVRIEKSGVLVTAGFIMSYTAPHIEHRELVLCNTEFVKNLFEDDIGLPVNERIFPQSICEYYDVDNDLVIKFYSKEGYDAYCEKEKNEAERNKNINKKKNKNNKK